MRRDSLYKKLNEKPSYSTSILGQITEGSFTMEFPINAVFPSTVIPVVSNIGKYTMDFKSVIGTFASPLVSVPLFTQFPTATAGQPGYSGKLRTFLERFQYMKLKGFKVSFISSVPDGSIVPFSNSKQYLDFTPSFNICVLPSTLNGYNGNNSNLTNPNDVYSYDASLRIQPTSSNGIISRYFLIPKSPITGRSNTNANNMNGWTNTNDLTDYDVNLIIGWAEAPVSTAAAANPAASFSLGLISIEVFCDFAVPIKNQNL